MKSFCDDKYCTVTILKFLYILNVFLNIFALLKNKCLQIVLSPLVLFAYILKFMMTFDERHFILYTNYYNGVGGIPIYIKINIFSNKKNILEDKFTFLWGPPLFLYVAVCFSDFHAALNVFPAETVAHLEAGQRRAATRFPGPDAVEVISVPALHMAPCFRSMGEQFMLRTSCL